MNNIDLEDTNALFILKADGQLVLKFLKDLDLISNKHKIDRTDTQLIIPLKNELDLNKLNFTSKLLGDIRQSRHKFEINKIVFNSIFEILTDIIPNELIKFLSTSYDQIGSIAVIDLKSEISEYKKKIGEAIMQIHPSILTVFRKSKAVSGSTRIRGLELISGVLNYETIHKEYGLNIFVNLEKIYFSPRLSTEHRRIAEQVKPKEQILDMFGAAAPFGLHIAKIQNAIVLTLDINEDAPKIISKSLDLNQNLIGEIVIHSGDAIEKTQEFLKQGLSFDRIIMNHPSNALKYLKFANSILKKDGILHVYSFVAMENHDNLCEQLIIDEVSGFQIIDIHKVRQYSPNEYHTCITIKKV